MEEAAAFFTQCNCVKKKLESEGEISRDSAYRHMKNSLPSGEYNRSVAPRVLDYLAEHDAHVEWLDTKHYILRWIP